MAKNKEIKAQKLILEEVKKNSSITGFYKYDSSKDLEKLKLFSLDSMKGIVVSIDTKNKATLVLNIEVTPNSSTKVIYNMLNLSICKKLKNEMKVELVNFVINVLNTSTKVK